MKYYAYIVIFLAAMSSLFAQKNVPSKFTPWRLSSYSGSVGVRGFYREQERIVNNIVDDSQYPFLYGAFSLYTTSYIGHPQLLRLDIGGEYNPGISQQTYTVSPDRSEVLTFNKLRLGATIFDGKPMNFGAHINFSKDLINREYVTSLATDSKEWGLNYNFYNKILPITATYTDKDWKQREIETGRTFKNRQKDLQVLAKRSFTNWGDKNEFRYNRFQYFREDQNFDLTSSLYDNFYLNNTFFLDPNKKHMFRSSLTYMKQRGQLSQNRFQAFESLRIKLPLRFILIGKYDHNGVQQLTQRYQQNRFSLGFEHKLFSSLKTTGNYDVFFTNHSAYEERNIRTGVSFQYKKKVPTGSLQLGYSYRVHYQKVESNPNSVVFITNEEKTLVDGQIVLLNAQFALVSTIVVKDITGAIIYQNNVDYIIIDRDAGFYEIQRIPGGQIPNNGIILIDYQAKQVGSYNFDSPSWTFTARLILFNRFLEMYYRHSSQKYKNVESESYLTLNYYNQDVVGGKITVGPFIGGIEYDLYRSVIVPYEKTRYFINVSANAGKKVLMSLNGEVTDLLLTETNTQQLYSSLFGKVIFMVNTQSKFNLDIGYRMQRGEAIDLDMFTGRLEYNLSYRKLMLKVGAEVYKRNYLVEQLRFKGVYFQVDRRF